MPLLRLASALGLAAALAACTSTASDMPLVDGRPNPQPVPGYRVVCATSVVGSPFNKATTTCRQEVAPGNDRAIVRARG